MYVLSSEKSCHVKFKQCVDEKKTNFINFLIEYAAAKTFIESGKEPTDALNYHRFLIKKPSGLSLATTTPQPDAEQKSRPKFTKIISSNESFDQLTADEKVSFFKNLNAKTASRLNEKYELVFFIQAHTRHDFLTILLDSITKVKKSLKILLLVSFDAYIQGEFKSF